MDLLHMVRDVLTNVLHTHTQHTHTYTHTGEMGHVFLHA
jgi:hypothetical protein